VLTEPVGVMTIVVTIAVLLAVTAVGIVLVNIYKEKE